MRDLPTCADLPAAYCPAAKTPGSELFRRPASNNSSDGTKPPRSDALPGCRDDVEIVPDPTLTWEDPSSWAQGPQDAGQEAGDEEIGTLPDPTLSWEDPDVESDSPQAEEEIGELPDPTLSWEEPDEPKQPGFEPQTGPVDEFPDPLLAWEESPRKGPGPDAGPLPVPGPVPVEAGPKPEQGSQPAPPPPAEPEPVLPPELRHGMEAPDEPRPVHLLTPVTDSAWGAPVARRIAPTAGSAKAEPKKRTVPKDNGCWQCS